MGRAADLLARKDDWGPLYDPERLARNEDDLYVMGVHQPLIVKHVDAVTGATVTVQAIVEAHGGTITHHHAVGRLHRPQYDQQRPDLFAEALRAALDLNPNLARAPELPGPDPQAAAILGRARLRCHAALRYGDGRRHISPGHVPAGGRP